jgi:N-acetyl-anhydromuramyl-L-alanine amidase AmpD
MTRIVTVIIALLILSAAQAWSARATSHGPKQGNVDRIIIHTISGPTCENGKVVYTGAVGDAVFWKTYFEGHAFLSIHYIIDRQGVTVASVPEDETANHALGHNEGSIGIELVHNGDGQEEFGQAQINALIGLLKQIRERRPIPISNIVSHAEIDGRVFPCGGDEVKTKPDPGANFPWTSVRAAMQESK